MSLQNFVKTQDWEELKQILKNEFELKPGDIDTSKSNEEIATDVKALNIAKTRVNKVIRSLQAKMKSVEKESWK